MSGRRSKQVRKSFAVGTLVACSAFSTQVAIAQDAPKAAPARGSVAELALRTFNIAPGTLDEALRAYKAAAQLEVRYAFAEDLLSRIGTGGVTGTMSNEQALSQLLSGTGVNYRFDSRRVVTISMQGLAETIDVVSAAPAVSSPKFTQPVLETPRTVTVIPDEVFTAQGATTLRDVLRNTPGITFQAGEGGGGLPGDTFSMRGFSSGNDITVDGVRDVGAYSRDAFNLEQVEVLKGPASAVSGRGSTGGSINLVTKTPKKDAFTRVSGALGTESYSRSTIDVNMPIEALGSSAFRINAMFGAAGVAGRDVVHNSSWGIAPSLTFGIGKPARFTLAYQHVAQDNVPDYGLPWAAFGATPAIDQSNFYGLEDYDYEDIESDLASAIFERDLRSGWVLRNVTRAGDNNRDSAITAPRPPNRQLQRRTMEMTQLANQTSVNGSFTTGGLRHDLAVGLELGREGTKSHNQAQATNQPLTTITDPDPSETPFGPMPANLGNPSETNLDLAALYAFDTLQLGQRWELTGGLRFDKVDVDYSLLNRTNGVVTNLERSDEMLSWSAGAIFKPRANATLYASVGTAFNPSVDAGTVGAALSDVPTAANNLNLDPEKTENLEVGGKWELGNGRAILTGALFRTTKTNARTRSATTEPFVLAGEQRVDGIELGINGHLTDRWTALAGYSHLQSEFTRSVNTAEVGAQLAFTPEHSFNVWTDYRLSKASFGGGVQFMDSVFRNSINTLEVPSYWLVGAMAAYEVTNSLTLRLNVNNLGDEQYVDRVGGGHYIPGAGRSVMLTAELRILMLLQIPEVLTAGEVLRARELLDGAEWVDGRVTAGHQSARAKDNQQVPEQHPAAREVGEMILTALARNSLFRAAALPLHVFPPLFNRYSGGQAFGSHVDNAVRRVPGTPNQIRTDVSATLFLCEPEAYDGGELVVEGTYGIQAVKLAAGSAVLYPATSLHFVRPVTRGARVASFFWIQSMVRDDGQRTLLFDLDLAIQRLAADAPDHASVLQLTGVYHNLLRRWADV